MRMASVWMPPHASIRSWQCDGSPNRRRTDVKTPQRTRSAAQVIIALTGIRQPALLNDWTHLFEVASWEAAQQQAALDVVRQFQAELSECAEKVDELNAQRVQRGGRKFVAFNPRILETSVSI